MIPRTLVPRKLLPAAREAAADVPRRLSTALDCRTVVPADLPAIPLDGKTTIPAHVPLEVLASRTVVPRDMPATRLETKSAIPQHVPLTVLDSRIVVPKDLPPAVLTPRPWLPAGELPGVVDPDILITGEVNLLVKPVEERVSGWGWQARVSSVLFHVCLIALLLLQPKLFPSEAPTQAQLELARKQLAFIYLAPYVATVPKLPPRPEPPSPQIRIDPRVLRQIAPPTEEAQTLPGAPERDTARVQRELPSAPTPQLPGTSGAEQRPGDKPREMARLETPKVPQGSPQLVLPPMSPGKALEDSLRGAAKGRGSDTGGFSGPVPSGPGGGAGQGYLGGSIQMLTPDEGVDFTNYLARLLASVKRNWYAVIPESARLGEKGRVVIQFHIQRDGNVPYPEPVLVSTSGREPLDRAAMSSVRASSPFEPLPPAFSAQFIELRFIFLYNLPLDYQ